MLFQVRFPQKCKIYLCYFYDFQLQGHSEARKSLFTKIINNGDHYCTLDLTAIAAGKIVIAQPRIDRTESLQALLNFFVFHEIDRG